MSRFAIKLQCPNPECLYAENRVGQPVCDRCQNPLTYRYLWAVGSEAAQVATGTLVDCRYLVTNPQIWLDTQPGFRPQTAPIDQTALPYLRLHSQRLHLPELFAMHQPADHLTYQSPIFLLDNAPIDATGKLLPLLEAAWTTASAARQLNWLWQMLQLWQQLCKQGVASSLLVSENLHIEGWRVRLRELLVDQASSGQVETQLRDRVGETAQPLAAANWEATSHLPQTAVLTPPTTVTTRPLTSTLFSDQGAMPSLQDLAEVWQVWAEEAYPTIRHQLRHLCEAMQTTPDAEIHKIADRLNHLLLEQTSKLPLQVQVAGATTSGTQRSHNEDACYPLASETTGLARVGIICDGIGGHEGGEVASQLTLRSLQLQLRTWLAELLLQTTPLSPQIVEQQLAGMVRVANNLLAAQNDLQKREQRQRMGTTLVMAVQPPQTLRSENGKGNTHELYLVHVGDSRAYWLTRQNCQLLTVDDDVAAREVRSGRSLYSQIIDRADAGALTQALGTREANQLRVNVQRLVLDEDGILLLCSDGLSDNGLVEQFWQAQTLPLLENKLSLAAVAQEWANLANRYNGHDNASVVLMHCRLSNEPHLFDKGFDRQEAATQAITQAIRKVESEETRPAESVATETDLTESAKQLLYDSELESHKAAVLPKGVARPAKKSDDSWLASLAAAALMFVLGALAIAIWREVAPTGFHPKSSSDLPADDLPADSPPASPSPSPSEALTAPHDPPDATSDTSPLDSSAEAGATAADAPADPAPNAPADAPSDAPSDALADPAPAAGE